MTNQELIGKACIPRKVANYNQKKRPFFVTQYVYDCQNFDGSEIDVLMKAIKTAANNGVYNDPFIDIEGKKAQMIELQPIQEQRYNNRKITEIKKHKIMKPNRNKVRLTESQLHKVIKESVRRILKEGFTNDPHEPYYEDLSVNLSYDGDTFNAYIYGNAGDSGYECHGSTPEELGDEVKQYIIDMFYQDGI